MSYTLQRSQPTNFIIDLMMVRNSNRVVSILGSAGPQVVPELGSIVITEDEDGNCYDSRVETILPDRRVYLRVDWATRRRSQRIADGYAINFGDPEWKRPREASVGTS